jgi:DNA excision repair protein ERCC-2
LFSNSAITVDKLIDQTLRFGDIRDGRGVSDSERTRALDEFHLTRDDCKFSYPITHLFKKKEAELTIFGSIDAVHETTPPLLETVAYTWESSKSFEPELALLDMSRAKLLAYLYCSKKSVKAVVLQINWYNRESLTPIVVKETYKFDELEEFAERSILTYLEWAEPFIGWPLIRDSSISKTKFPYSPYRVGQYEMMGEVFLGIKNGEERLIEAPTGIGKTLASIFPALKALEKGHTARLFYLTARNTGKNVAEKALKILNKNGTRLKAVTITSKDKTCARRDAVRECDDCKYAIGYYSRLKEGLHAAFHRDLLFRDEVEKIAKEFLLCPFEFALDIALHSDIIICDYNYVFDPNVYLKRFFADVEENYTFLIDEVHNLVDRARSMYSGVVEKDHILHLQKILARVRMEDLNNEMDSLLSILSEQESRCDNSDKSLVLAEPPYKVFKQARNVIKMMDEALANKEFRRYHKPILELYFELRHFINMGNRFDEDYCTILKVDDSGFSITLFNINPAKHIKKSLEMARSSALFSATISPHHYFKKVFGLPDDTRSISLPSPFPAQNLKLLVADRISTKYVHRATTIRDVVGAIETIINHRVGNYMVFFPSYEYMNATVDLFLTSGNSGGVSTVVQVPKMSEELREEYLANFDKSATENEQTLVGFAVMGGVFGEGIDLVGDKLNGVVVVGVGLPGISPDREEIKSHFGGGEEGFDYSYTYPGINKVLQAAGRVIRTEEDRGVVVLIDERFGTPRYLNLFPPNWKPEVIRNRDDIRGFVDAFYGEEGVEIEEIEEVEE